jgi:hypothetical protein
MRSDLGTFHSTLSEAQSFVDRAHQINAKAETARQAKIQAVNSAITIVLSAAAIVVFFAVWDQQLADQGKINQEQIASWTK